MNIDELCVAEYSRSQKQFHVDYLKASLKTNIDSVLNDEPNDWIPIGIFTTYQDAMKYAKDFKKKMQEKQIS